MIYTMKKHINRILLLLILIISMGLILYLSNQYLTYQKIQNCTDLSLKYYALQNSLISNVDDFELYRPIYGYNAKLDTCLYRDGAYDTGDGNYSSMEIVDLNTNKILYSEYEIGIDNFKKIQDTLFNY